MKTLIKNGRVITATDDYKADILIEGERVSVIGAKLEMEADKVIDASGKLVIPDGIDQGCCGGECSVTDQEAIRTLVKSCPFFRSMYIGSVVNNKSGGNQLQQTP